MQPSLDDFRRLVEVDPNPGHYPNADGIDGGVLRYGTSVLTEPDRGVDEELARALLDGPGVVLIAGAVAPSIVDRASATIETIIEQERAAGAGAGDHFAAPGANQRVWNALEKMAVADPDVFVDYHGNPVIDRVARAWLGPAYQMTTQVNVINPGGAAQQPHRDYHLGFMTDAEAAAYPRHAHRLSPVLTLQGAIAHVDMAVDAGPTMLLPHSQRYELGYLAWRRPEFIDYFTRHHRQPALAKGDAVFFNPALFHAGGQNRTTDVRRMANLLQISSAMGRAMETVDRERMVNALYPTLLARWQGGKDRRELAAAVAAAAEGYPFPTNLDRDPPIDGLRPRSQYDMVMGHLEAGDAPFVVTASLADRGRRRESN